MVKSHNALAQYLLKLGITLILILVGLVFGLYGLHELSLLNAWALPLKPLFGSLAGLGFGCLIISMFMGLNLRWLWGTALLGLISLNGLSYLGAYVLTHSKPAGQIGIGFARPENQITPESVGLTYATQEIPIGSQAWLESWSIKVSQPKGSVLLFPGNKASKDKLLAPAQVFHQLGYDTWLVHCQD